MNNNGLINLEILLYFMILIIIFSTLISIVTTEFDVVEQTQNRKEARLITMGISHAINNIYTQPKGFKQYYTLPEKINEESYVLEINDSKVYVNSHYQLCRDKLIVENITFYGKNRKNIVLIPGDTYCIEHKNNSIDIYQ